MFEDLKRCDGCTQCAIKCVDKVNFSRFEYERVVEFLRKSDDKENILRILEQNKTREWFEDITFDVCVFLDNRNDFCVIYPYRPLICRLFGIVRHLPCPIGEITEFVDASEIISDYTRENELDTFSNWMARDNIFNFEDLLGGDFHRYYEV